MIRLNEQVLRIISEGLFYCKFWLVMLLLVIPFLFSQEVLAFQYENYEWGISKEEAINLVNKNGHNIIAKTNIKKDNKVGIAYYDELFGKKITIHMVFTPKSKKLYIVQITPKDQLEYADTFYRELLPVLKDKYGDFTEPSGYHIKDVHLWSDGNTNILLRHGFKTVLFYRNNKYKQIRDKEMQNIHMKESKDKL